jgi:hypothetical protein
MSLPDGGSSMHVHKKEARLLRKSIAIWQDSALIDAKTAQSLTESLHVISFDWKKLSIYSFLISIACIIIAITSILTDEYLKKLLHLIFDAPHGIKCLGLSVVSAIIIAFGIRIRKKYPAKVLSSEAVLFLGVLAIAGAIYELGLALDTGSGHFSLLILLSCIIYAALGYLFQSNLIWFFSLLTLGGWLGAETGYASGWGAYYLGMNYPLRFTLFGGVLTAVALAMRKKDALKIFQHTTLVMGLLYLFIALWILSIFGNHGDEKTWQAVKQIELFHWSLLFAIASGCAIYHGLRYDNATTKGFGLTFLLINLYTRFFELFWDSTNKIIFFILLSFSFWGLGHLAEKIWNLGEKKDESIEPQQ